MSASLVFRTRIPATAVVTPAGSSSLRCIEGKLFRPMAMGISFAMVGSLVLSLTFIPALSSLLLRQRPPRELPVPRHPAGLHGGPRAGPRLGDRDHPERGAYRAAGGRHRLLDSLVPPERRLSPIRPFGEEPRGWMALRMGRMMGHGMMHRMPPMMR
jgi:multidrug efflux pump subunit AcrB